MPGKFRYKVKYRISREGSIEVNANNDSDAGDCVEEAGDDGDLQPDGHPEFEVLDVSCLDTGICTQCGAEASADLLAHTKGLCRACVG